jgi:cation diffusion facilitator family transporter
MENAADYSQGLKTSVMGLVTNAGLATIKLLAGILGNSYALIADAVESMADIFASVVVWSGLRIASMPADKEHPYGHGKAEPLAAFIVALMLFAAGAGIAVQAVREILLPDHMPPASFTLIVLFVVITVKEGFFRMVHRVGMAMGSSAVKTDAWHHRSDAITSAAAAVGIGIALVGGPKYAAADDWAALAASTVILYNAYRLIQPPLHELMDRVPMEIIDRVRSVAVNAPGVAGVEKIFARKSGMSYYVDMHMEVDPDISVRRAHALAHEVKALIRAAVPTVQDVLIHIEPHGGPPGVIQA